MKQTGATPHSDWHNKIKHNKLAKLKVCDKHDLPPPETAEGDKEERETLPNIPGDKKLYKIFREEE